jgi:predicted RNA-binding Zn-ribbon protein involved in translation (DUF1610 family)
MGEAGSGSGGTEIQNLPSIACMRCGGEDTVRLEKARIDANTCFRCRGCGHIFSPVGRIGD